MTKRLTSWVAVALSMPAVAMAEVPSVATDIAPIHSLVAKVMGELGAPSLIVPPGASPHGYAMRPSEARALSEADLVVWAGEGLEPWLSKSIASLAGDAEALELLEVPGTQLHEFRSNDLFEHEEAAHAGAVQHASEGDHADEHHHDHDDEEAENDHHDGEGDHDHHDHHGTDPHAWLDPANAQVWLTAIAEALSAIDPENGTAYADNAAAAQAELATLGADITDELAPLGDVRFIVLHDAFQYFERRFGLQAVGALSLGDAADPTAARVAALRDEVRRAGVSCMVTEPQFNAALVDTVAEGANVKTVVLDPLGVSHDPGQGLYTATLRDIADGFATCR
ncbi:zinc ABC transporter substrate-binding protein [Tropicimonas isoalkanivorans]|uniref:High-affinity zinc uptake system protein ZnuA n=1 Tax=Tropicimonas isoalkanivorans TaxID=441112 RepID=A0A1I1FR30_9RHOB|nr:zinc ABC transporter substrate-binding protein [Tropicimonas isoalkanivorans]SFC01897.1 zinc transport system substrate-binding protein [Tropicimonas isoalkanivorans]